MAIWYIDYENGSDANDGTSWAQAWKTINGATAAKGVAAGDTIRVAKSPDPTSLGQTALWTNLSRDVVLQTGPVVAEIDYCESTAANWTASSNVTLTDDTSQYKMGANSLKVAVAVGFTTGKAAYRDFGAGNEKDLSGYQQISFWLRNSAAIAAAGYVKIKLCSDASGDTPVNTFSLPAIPSTNSWVPITIDTGSALGNSIRSIAVYIDTDFGAVDLYLDDIIACKAPSSADSLTLQSLISKNSAAQGGNELWYPIQSINGTTIKIDNYTNQLGNGGRGYTGTTETVAIYKRETIKTTMVASGNVQAFQVNGQAGSLVAYEGGYNTSTTTQDGETLYDGQNSKSYGVVWSSISYTKPNWLGTVRYQYGFYGTGNGSSNNNPQNLRAIANEYGFHFVSSHKVYAWELGTLRANNNYRTGIVLQGSLWKQTSGTYLISHGAVYGPEGVSISGLSFNLANIISKNNAQYGVNISASNTRVGSVETADNNSGSISLSNVVYNPYIGNLTYSEATPVFFSYDYENRLSVGKIAGVDTFKTFIGIGTVLGETTVRHTASGYAWKFNPTHSGLSASWPLYMKIAEVAVNPNAQVTVKAWMRRSNTGLTLSLVCRGGQIAGVANDVISSMTAGADTWEEVQIQFTPTEAGVVEIEVWAYGGTSYSGYVDDMTITQA